MKYLQSINNEDHSEWLLKSGLSRAEFYKNNKIDLLLFTGGSDVHPKYYHENIGSHTYCDIERDKREIELYKILEDIPKLGICRGGQLLTVLNGGKLIQHTNGHSSSHDMFLTDCDKFITTTSSHHQMMYPWSSPNKFYILACSFGLSNTYLDGNNQEIFPHLLIDQVKEKIINTRKHYISKIIEPEIIYWPETNCLCIQGHPEWGDVNSDFTKICNFYVDLLLKGKLEEYVKNI